MYTVNVARGYLLQDDYT